MEWMFAKVCQTNKQTTLAFIKELNESQYNSYSLSKFKPYKSLEYKVKNCVYLFPSVLFPFLAVTVVTSSDNLSPFPFLLMYLEGT